jgi:hypothetical protein
MKSLVYGAVILLTAGLAYVVGLMVWSELQTRGDRYFARPLAERRRLVKRLRATSALYLKPSPRSCV